MKTKKAYTMARVLDDISKPESAQYIVMRNYKNGKQRAIGKPYDSTWQALAIVKAKNYFYKERHGSEWLNGAAPWKH